MAETICVLPHRTAHSQTKRCSAFRWEAAYEICPGERQSTPPALRLRILLRSDRGGLRARAGNASLLLHSRLLLASLQSRRAVIRTAGEGVMKWREDAAGRAQVHKHQVCDRFGGRFGMVTHRWWRSMPLTISMVERLVRSRC